MGSKALNLGTDSYKAALFNNSITPDNTVSSAVLTEYNGSGSQWLTANEVTSSAAWPSGGESLTSVTWTQALNVVTFTAATTSSSSGATLTNVYGTLVYDTTVNNEGLSFNYFGGANSVSAGTFAVIWSASGIATFSA